MAFENDNGMFMPVAPAYGNNNFDGNGSWWILLLFILLGGWGNGFNGYGNGAGFVENSVQNGFDQSAIISGITGINSNVVNGFSQAEIAANARAVSDMQQMFALQSQFAQACCDNRLATTETQNIVQNEANATRAAIQAQTQAILDTMCQDKIDTKNGEILALERQLAMANLQASQVAQTAEIISKLPASTTA